MAVRTTRAARVARVLEQLAEHYPGARCSLAFRTPLELLVATILSAQCTDERVNRVTASLFEKYRTAADYASADPEALQQAIRPTGFFRNKAASIIGAARAIVERHGGQVPRTLEELVALPGVGRKTANVVLGNAFGVPGLVVDTHVGRVSRRLGLAAAADPAGVESELMRVVPRERWVLFSHQLIAHGRAVCRAQRPRCAACFFDETLCPSRRVFLAAGGTPRGAGGRSR